MRWRWLAAQGCRYWVVEERYNALDETIGEAPTASRGGGATMCWPRTDAALDWQRSTTMRWTRPLVKPQRRRGRRCDDVLGEVAPVSWETASVKRTWCGGSRCLWGTSVAAADVVGGPPSAVDKGIDEVAPVRWWSATVVFIVVVGHRGGEEMRRGEIRT